MMHARQTLGPCTCQDIVACSNYGKTCIGTTIPHTAIVGTQHSMSLHALAPHTNTEQQHDESHSNASLAAAIML